MEVTSTGIATDWAPTHPQVMSSRGVEVDAGIAPLLEVLWAYGLETEFSCQGARNGQAHIAFTTMSQAEQFAASSRGVAFRRALTFWKKSRWVFFPSDSIDYLTRVWSGRNG